MNKYILGAVAAASGTALLLGGAGTFALWNSTASVGTGTVDSGTLTIAASGAPVVEHEGSGDTAALIVPGDTVVVSQQVSIDASGDNLAASLGYDPGAGGLWDLLTVDAFKAFDINGDEVTGLTDLDATEATSITSIELTVTLPTTVGDAPAPGDQGQDLSADLSDVTFTLSQNS